MRYSLVLVVIVFSFIQAVGQNDLAEKYRAYIVRQDGNTVVFNIETKKEKGETVLFVINATEKIRIDEVVVTKDSVNFSMPVFESSFKSRRNANGSLQGIWRKGTSGEFQHWPFYAFPNQSFRFEPNLGGARNNITGTWDVTFTRSNGTTRKAVAEFTQNNDKLTGSFITPTGDYRYLDGIVTGDSLKLSTFDGAHAYTFYAKVDNAQKISGGVYLSGINGKEAWTATRDEDIKEPVQNEPTRLKQGESKLNFTFNDLNGLPVSINDKQFQNKVVIIQIMGSWCPNCMDETKFLSEFYSKNKSRGVEIIALAYEYSTDIERSKQSLKKFQQRFNVQYPMLITGVTSSDEQKTEKTLPQLTPIRAFPTTIFIDKKGKVRDIHGAFYGPGTGRYHEEFLKIFNGTVEGLLKEN